MGLALKKPDDVAGKSWPAIVVGLFVAFGGVLFGYDVSKADQRISFSTTNNMIDWHHFRYFSDAILDQRVQNR